MIASDGALSGATEATNWRILSARPGKHPLHGLRRTPTATMLRPDRVADLESAFPIRGVDSRLAKEADVPDHGPPLLAEDDRPCEPPLDAGTTLHLPERMPEEALAGNQEAQAEASRRAGSLPPPPPAERRLDERRRPRDKLEPFGLDGLDRGQSAISSVATTAA
jgi:hypothetical protein